jgi:hypothetical protein
MQSRLINHAKLLVATLTFLVSLGSLVVGSVAWFASSSYLEISRFKITMGENEQIDIGLKVPAANPSLGEPGSIVYYNSVDDETLKNHYYYNPWETFRAVTSMYQSLWLDETTDLSDPNLYPVLRKQYTSSLVTKETEPTTGNFYQFEFFIKASVRIDLYLDPASYVVANRTKNNETAISHHLNAASLNKVEDAMRVSFLSSERFLIWEPNVDVASTTEFGGRLDVLMYDRAYDYDPITNKEIMFGEYNSDDYLIYDESARVSSVTKHSAFEALTAPGIEPLSIPLSKQNGLVIAKEQSVTTSFMTDFSNPDAALLRLYPNEPQRLVVSIYAEGWDHDTTNDINLSSFLLNLVFGGRYAPL